MQGEQRLAPDAGAGLRRAQDFAFEVEVGQLVQRVVGPQPCAELQPVDDPYAVVEPDVLGAKVAMGVDDAAGADALGEELAPGLKEPLQDAVDMPDPG